MRKKENIQTYKKNISKIREYYKLKDLLYKTSKTEFALNKINEFLEKYPNDSVALSLCASVLRQRGDPESGLLLLTEVDCDSLQSIKERSLCYLEMEEESRALLEIDKIPINNLEADSEIETLRFLLEVEQGFHDQAILRKLTYAKQQMVDYNKERLFYHLEKY